MGPPASPAAGRPRSFWSCLGLGIVTLGIYFLYYQHAAFREVDRESGHTHASGLFAFYVVAFVGGRLLSMSIMDTSLAWFAVGVGALAVTCLAAYLFLEVQNLNLARARMSLPRALHPAILPAFYAGTWGASFASNFVSGVTLDAMRATLILLLLVHLLAWWALCRGINGFWEALQQGLAKRSPAA